MMDETRKLARWRSRISEFDVKVVHRAGIKHQAADPLPHLPTARMDVSLLEEDATVLMITEVQPEGEKKETVAKIWA